MLNEAKGNGTSMISLILPPKSQISQTQTMLQTEYGTASNIKSRVNRQSVLGAITSAQQRLKLYTKVPPNGLIVYTGTVVTDEGKERKMNIDFEPFKPINTSLYLCDNKFHTEALSELMETDQKYGFIVMDGHGSLYGTLSGNHREVLHKFTVDLPKKHGRGGQSALRFARLRMEKRHNYVRKVAEIAVQHFITNDRPNVAGLVLAGSADFKTELSQSDMFDLRLQQVIMAIVDVSYGTWSGGVVGISEWVPYQFPVGWPGWFIRPDRHPWREIKWRLPDIDHTVLLVARFRTLAPAAGTPVCRHSSDTDTYVQTFRMRLDAFSTPSRRLDDSQTFSNTKLQAAKTASTKRSSCRQRRWPTSSLSKKSAFSPSSSTRSPRTRANSASGCATPSPASRWAPWRLSSSTRASRSPDSSSRPPRAPRTSST